MITRRLILFLICLFATGLVAGCGVNTQPLLTSTFNEAAGVAKGWVSACTHEDARSAIKFWSKGYPQLAETESIFLCDLHKETKFELISVEDRSSLISSGLLWIFLRRSNGKQGLLQVQIANSDSGPVLFSVSYLPYCNRISPIQQFADCFWQ